MKYFLIFPFLYKIETTRTTLLEKVFLITEHNDEKIVAELLDCEAAKILPIFRYVVYMRSVTASKQREALVEYHLLAYDTRATCWP